MHTTTRHLRNDLVISLRAQGRSIPFVADHVGISERHVSRIISERRMFCASAAEGDPQGGSWTEASVTELLDRIEKSLGQSAEIAKTAGEHAGLASALTVALDVSLAHQALAELRRRAVAQHGEVR